MERVIEISVEHGIKTSKVTITKQTQINNNFNDKRNDFTYKNFSLISCRHPENGDTNQVFVRGTQSIYNNTPITLENEKLLKFIATINAYNKKFSKPKPSINEKKLKQVTNNIRQILGDNVQNINIKINNMENATSEKYISDYKKDILQTLLMTIKRMMTETCCYSCAIHRDENMNMCKKCPIDKECTTNTKWGKARDAIQDTMEKIDKLYTLK